MYVATRNLVALLLFIAACGLLADAPWHARAQENRR
jgi:hypothetical protein